MSSSAKVPVMREPGGGEGQKEGIVPDGWRYSQELAEFYSIMDGRGRAFGKTFEERLWRSVNCVHVYLQAIQTVREAWTVLREFFPAS